MKSSELSVVSEGMAENSKSSGTGELAGGRE